MELRWRPSLPASGLHAADALRRGQALADPRLAALAEPAAALAEEIAAAGLPEERGWSLLLAHAADAAGWRHLAQTTLVKALGAGARTEALVAPLAGRLSDLHTTFVAALPRLAEELPLRVGPLREQWEARGPGLLHMLGLTTDPALLAEQAEVIVVHPALGGGGAAHLETNSVRIEGVLANPLAELPEVVRLAWLLSQLQCDLPRFSDLVPRDRLPQAARLALLPPVLAAAAEVELVRPAPDLVDQALTAWRLVPAEDDRTAEVVRSWWQTYRASRPGWPVALTALDRLLG